MYFRTYGLSGLTLFKNIFLECLNETAKVPDSKIQLLVIFFIKLSKGTPTIAFLRTHVFTFSSTE